MSKDKKKLPLAIIAKRKELSTEEVLFALIPYSIIYAHVENVTLANSIYSMEFPITDLPIPEMYLHIIWSKGAWEGNRIQIHSFDIVTGNIRIDEAIFNKDIRIGIEELFVYEDEFMVFETKLPKMVKQGETVSIKQENNLYLLIGVFLDMLVDKGGDNHAGASPSPDSGKSFVFNSQAELRKHIENVYPINGYGLKESSLEDKFSKANTEFAKIKDKLSE